MRWSGLVVVLACSSGTDGGPIERIEYRPCALGTRVGGFAIELVAEPPPGFTSVSGKVAAGVVPAQVGELVRAAGDCRLLRKRTLFCDPACTSAETCGEDRKCIPFPANQKLGAVTVTGLVRPVRMTPTPGGLYFDTTLPQPGFAPSAPIRLQTEGGDLPAFTLRGAGVPPLTLPTQPLMLESSAPLSVSWTIASAPAARIQLTLDIDQHGSTPATLVCDTPDSGSFTIPADVITDLLTAGTSGYPQLTISRRTADSTLLPPGCVDLTVEAALTRPLQVRGHTPCTRPADCPAGLTCDIPRQTCR
jgi:hypothetical protein